MSQHDEAYAKQEQLRRIYKRSRLLTHAEVKYLQMSLPLFKANARLWQLTLTKDAELVKHRLIL